jgi:outer membrane protein assembly factor BamA
MRFPSSCNPTSGSLASTTLETSGFGGDVAVAKAEVLRQHHIALNNSVSLAVSARAGVAQPWSNINKIVNAVIAGKAADNTPAAKGPYTAVPVLDRFFHNTLFVRGVAPRDIGPKAGADALGGDLYTAATVSLSAAIPRYEQLPVRPHVFVNAGNLVSLTDFLNNPGDRKCPMSGSTKASVGTGIVLGTQLGRIELNMAAPVTNDGIGKFAFSLGGSIDW